MSVQAASLKLSWDSVPWADGYEIYYSNYYKVRAYKTVKGKKVYGAYSVVKKVKCLSLIHISEPTRPY